MAFELIDDGTLNTVVRCSECGKEYRYNYQDSCDEFVAECIDDATDHHICEFSESDLALGRG